MERASLAGKLERVCPVSVFECIEATQSEVFGGVLDTNDLT